jgi:uncharacterized protein YkwD
MNRIAAVLFTVGALLAPAASGQHAQHDDVEVIEPPKVKPAPDARKPDLAGVAKRVVEKTNAFRKEQGRGPAEVNAELADAASTFARYMAKTDRYGHTADGKRPADRAKGHGYEHCIVLENIAYQYNSSGFATGELGAGYFEGWKESPGHRKNMLDPDVTETGVAVARSAATGYYYAVQMFGRPRSKAIEYRITNRSGEPVKYQIGERTFELPPLLIRTHTRCRPGEVTFRLPGGGESKTMTPSNGDRFVVTKADGGFRVEKE